MEKTMEEKAKAYDEMMILLKVIFPGEGNVNFDGQVIDALNVFVNPADDWKYNNAPEM